MLNGSSCSLIPSMRHLIKVCRGMYVRFIVEKVSRAACKFDLIYGVAVHIQCICEVCHAQRGNHKTCYSYHNSSSERKPRFLMIIVHSLHV